MNAVNPGLIDTQVARDVVAGDEQAYAEIAKNVPIGRAGRPEEIASTVLWLCSPRASYIVGPRAPKTTGRLFANPFSPDDGGANCMRCGYLVEPAREKRGLMTCSGCG